MKCSICGKKIIAPVWWKSEDKYIGNNPYPIYSDPKNWENERCCDVCNEQLVIPVRFKINILSSK